MLELNLQRAVLNDRYETRGRISSGSYAEVFVARDRESENAVVIIEQSFKGWIVKQ
jgi:hypothetical protein